jgi:hypothetical protein
MVYTDGSIEKINSTMAGNREVIVLWGNLKVTFDDFSRLGRYTME